ncbi:MAG: phage tail tube protein [Negativicutes bacterium]|nr:phage tail tube protein [Negativicutes bacterium]
MKLFKCLILAIWAFLTSVVTTARTNGNMFSFDLQRFALLPTDGVNFVVAINTGTDVSPVWSVLGGQRGATFKVSANNIDASSKTSQGWTTTIPGLRSWGIDADALILTDDAGGPPDVAYNKLFSCFMARTKVNVRYTKADGTKWQGYATITDLSEDSPHDGEATYKLSLAGIGAPAMASGAQQVETMTVVGGPITTAGNLSVIVQKTGMTGSPKTLTVAVAVGDSGNVVAQKIREAMNADTAVSGVGAVSGTGLDVVWTFTTAAANDANANISYTIGTVVGVTAVPFSSNTVAGVAPFA